MKRKIIKILFVLVLTAIPIAVYADYPLPPEYRPGNAPPSYAERHEGKFGTSDIVLTLGSIMSVLLTVAGGVAVYFIVFGGFTYVTSFGNQEKTDKAKNIIKWAVLGLLVIIFSYIIVENVLKIATTDVGEVMPGELPEGAGDYGDPAEGEGEDTLPGEDDTSTGMA